MNIENVQKIKDLAGPDWMSDCIEVGCGDGWFRYIEDLIVELKALEEIFPEIKDLKILQIKEKFGELRFYYEIGTDTLEEERRRGLRSCIESLIIRATRLTSITCAICGDPGLGNGPYGAVRCLKH